MIGIQKRAEPVGLARLRRSAKAAGYSPQKAYSKLKKNLKNQVRQNLVAEQGGLCAYCMCRIPRLDAGSQVPIIIEHRVPRNPVDGRDVGQGLDYDNLLAVCHGNRASRGTKKPMDLTCDAHRKNIEFRKVNPCDPGTLTSIFYELDGKIGANDVDVNADLVDTLNLNTLSSPLIGERKAALDSLLLELGNVMEADFLRYCVTVLHEFQEETNPKTPYVGILIWYLRSMVDKLSDKIS